MRLFRESLLARLADSRASSEAMVLKLLAWRHPGFSAHLGEPAPFEDAKTYSIVVLKRSA